MSRRGLLLLIATTVVMTVVEARRLPGDEGGAPNIVGGVPAAEGAFPAYAITKFRRPACGMTLIWPDIMLTAAHCQILSDTTVYIGTDRVDGVGALDTQEVAYSYAHPDFLGASAGNDIRLLKLRNPSTVTPKAFNTDPAVPADGDPVTVIGFGDTVAGGYGSDTLRQVQVNVVNSDECVADFDGGVIPEQMICAASPGKDACQDDSGGPLFAGEDGEIVGIVSWGRGCADPDFPGVYTRVSQYSEWIQNTICGMSSVPPEGCVVPEDFTLPPTPAVTEPPLCSLPFDSCFTYYQFDFYCDNVELCDDNSDFIDCDPLQQFSNDCEACRDEGGQFCQVTDDNNSEKTICVSSETLASIPDDCAEQRSITCVTFTCMKFTDASTLAPSNGPTQQPVPGIPSLAPTNSPFTKAQTTEPTLNPVQTPTTESPITSQPTPVPSAPSVSVIPAPATSTADSTLSPVDPPSQSPTTVPRRRWFCFSGQTLVKVQGTEDLTPMHSLKVGDSVLTDNDTFSMVYSFGHFAPDAETEFLQLHVADTGASINNNHLEITSDHMLYVYQQLSGTRVLIPAGLVKVGDRLVGGTEQQEQCGSEGQVVESIQKIKRRGAYAPFTVAGDIMVNGVVASNFIALPFESLSFVQQHWLQYAAYTPYRFYCTLIAGCVNESYDEATGLAKAVTMWLPVLHFLEACSDHYSNGGALHGTLYFVTSALWCYCAWQKTTLRTKKVPR